MSRNFKQIRFDAQGSTSIEQMDSDMALEFCKTGIIDIVKTYPNAGERLSEGYVSDGEPKKLKRQLARVISIVKENGHVLSPNTDYEIWTDGRLSLPQGKYQIEYYAFPELSDLIETDEVPLPEMFTEALPHFLSYKYHGRLEGEADTRTSYYAEMYNEMCLEAKHFYAAQQKPKRMPPTRRI